MANRVLNSATILCLFGTAAAASGDTAFVTCQSGEEVAVVDLATGRTDVTWAQPGKPAGVALGGNGDVFVVAPEAKSVRRLSQASGKKLAEIRLEGGPTGIAFDAIRDRLFVSDWFNARLWVIDVATMTVAQTLATGTSPAGIALSPDGRFLASADKDADQVSLFDAETLRRLGVVSVGTRPYGLRFAPDGRLFVGNVGTDDMTIIDPETIQTVATIPVGDRPYGVAFAKGRAFVTNQYENTISVIDLKTLNSVATLDAGEYPEGIDTTSDGNAVAFVNWFDNTISVIDAQSLDTVSTSDTCDGPRAFGTFLASGD